MPERPSRPGTLHVVATPLGHLEDLTLRALRVLREVALVACEDTRRTANLLRAHGIATPTTSYFEHNERWKGDRILEALRSGRDVALVSDAGTPGISDPGFRLVRDARAEGLPVVPVPGPSAAVAALSVSGLPTDRFLFVGFLPKKTTARRRALEELAAERPTLVFYESPVRVLDAVDDMVAVLGDRDAFLCREATKVHEEYLRAPLSDLRATLAGRDSVKGEIVLVVSGAPEAAPPGDQDPVALYRSLAADGRPRRAAVKEAARRLSLPAREVYRRVQEAESERAPNPGQGQMRIILSSVFVDDQAKALAFYTDVLGFARKQDLPAGRFRWLTVVSPADPDGVELLLEPNENPAARTFQKALFEQGIPLTSFGVDDVEGDYARLAARGVVFQTKPTRMGPVTVAVFEDTCGNLIQIVQR